MPMSLWHSPCQRNRKLTAGGASSTMAAHLLVGASTTLSSTSANAESALPPVVITAAATVIPCPKDIDRLAEVTSPLPVVMSMGSAPAHTEKHSSAGCRNVSLRESANSLSTEETFQVHNVDTCAQDLSLKGTHRVHVINTHAQKFEPQRDNLSLCCRYLRSTKLSLKYRPTTCNHCNAAKMVLVHLVACAYKVKAS